MRIIYYLYFLLFVSNSFATQCFFDIFPKTQIRPYFITFSAGPAWTSAGQNQTYFLQPGVLNRYVANRNTSSLGVGEVFVGWQSRLQSIYYGQLGLAVTGSSAANLTGDIWEFANPALNNWKYNYNLNQWRVALKGKLITQDVYTRLCVYPYISASIGASFNHAYNYSLVSSPTVTTPNIIFTNHTQSSYAATMGIGLQRKLKKHWQVGVGYELADWGYSQLGVAPNQTINTGIAMTHLYANELLFNLTYVE
jgi:opacity protein-like surface antigen